MSFGLTVHGVLKTPSVRSELIELANMRRPASSALPPQRVCYNALTSAHSGFASHVRERKLHRWPRQSSATPRDYSDMMDFDTIPPRRKEEMVSVAIDHRTKRTSLRDTLSFTLPISRVCEQSQVFPSDAPVSSLTLIADASTRRISPAPRSRQDGLSQMSVTLRTTRGLLGELLPLVNEGG